MEKVRKDNIDNSAICNINPIHTAVVKKKQHFYDSENGPSQDIEDMTNDDGGVSSPAPVHQSSMNQHR